MTFAPISLLTLCLRQMREQLMNEPGANRATQVQIYYFQ